MTVLVAPAQEHADAHLTETGVALSSQAVVAYAGIAVRVMVTGVLGFGGGVPGLKFGGGPMLSYKILPSML